MIWLDCLQSLQIGCDRELKLFLSLEISRFWSKQMTGIIIWITGIGFWT